MQREPLVSVIIPLYNRVDLIHETLQSVISQIYNNWEAVIVDDGSTDGSFELVQEIAKTEPRIKLFRREQEPKGAPACRNIGLIQSEGALILYLDSDDLLSKDGIKKITSIIDENPDYEAYVLQTGVFYDVPYDTCRVWNYLAAKENDLVRFLKEDPPWGTTATCWRRKTIEKLNGFDQDALCYQDWELHIRALLSGVKIWKAPDSRNFITSFHRIYKSGSHDISSNTKKEKYLISKFETYKKLHQKIEAIEPINNDKNIKQELSRLFLRLANHFYLVGDYGRHLRTITYIYEKGLISIQERPLLSYISYLHQKNIYKFTLLRIPNRFIEHFLRHKKYFEHQSTFCQAVLND
jgi:glycosyltransferase involved in cell wall biosynthesis